MKRLANRIAVAVLMAAFALGAGAQEKKKIVMDGSTTVGPIAKDVIYMVSGDIIRDQGPS